MFTHSIERTTVRLRVLLLCPTRLTAALHTASRVLPPPEGHQIGARKRRTRRTPSSTNTNAVASLNRLNWLNRVDSKLATSLEGEMSPALHPPKRPSHTHTPKVGFVGRGHEINNFRVHSKHTCLWSLRIFPSLPGSRLTFFLSRCKFSTLTTRQPMVEFYLLTFPRFPLRKNTNPTLV